MRVRARLIWRSLSLNDSLLCYGALEKNIMKDSIHVRSTCLLWAIFNFVIHNSKLCKTVRVFWCLCFCVLPQLNVTIKRSNSMILIALNKILLYLDIYNLNLGNGYNDFYEFSMQGVLGSIKRFIYLFIYWRNIDIQIS